MCRVIDAVNAVVFLGQKNIHTFGDILVIIDNQYVDVRHVLFSVGRVKFINLI